MKLQGEQVHLTAQKTSVLTYLIHHKVRLVSRTELAKHIYGHDTERPISDTRTWAADPSKHQCFRQPRRLRGQMIPSKEAAVVGSCDCCGRRTICGWKLSLR